PSNLWQTFRSARKHQLLNDRWPANHGKSGLPGYPDAENGVGQAFVETRLINSWIYGRCGARAGKSRRVSRAVGSARRRNPLIQRALLLARHPVLDIPARRESLEARAGS